MPALQDERSVMSFLFRPAAILISQSFYRTMNVVMMDSHQGCVFVGLWSATWTLIPFGFPLVPWEDRRTVETGSHTGVSVWRRVLCSVARLSRLPFTDTACLRRVPQFGRMSVVWRRMLQSRLFHNAGWRWYLLLRLRKCAVVCRCAVAQEMDIPRVKHRMRGK